MNDRSNPNVKNDATAIPTADQLDETLHAMHEEAALQEKMDATPDESAVHPDGTTCPEISDWLRLAIGDLNAEKKQALLSHAATCGVCLARLQKAQGVLVGGTTPAEEAALADYQSTTPAWQHRLAVELAHTAHQTPRMRWPRLFAWTTASAAALAVAVTAVVLYQRENSPDRLLAQAYTQSRSFDLRVPGAGFAPVTPETHLRGGAVDQESAPLLTARAQIERKLQKTPTDPHWLQLKARAELMDEHYDSAIDILDQLVASGPVSADLLLDDGTAYFLRGTATGSENDRATALDTLRRADEMNPADPVILFNEALVMEDRGQVMNAVETWHRYLQFEHDAKWQDEGRAHLKTLEGKLNQLKTHESRMEQHLATPQAMRALAADPATLSGIDEEMSTTFLPRMIDAAYPLPVDRSRGSPCTDNCLASRALLHSLAASLQTNHQDHWLTEFLPSDSSPINSKFAEAAHALGRAIDADTQGNYSDAAELAALSTPEFAALGNKAGAERAQVERAFALQRSFKFAACHQAVKYLYRDDHFAWIAAQAVAVDAGCDTEPGWAAANNPLFARAIEQAEAHNYVLLKLRARNMFGGFAAESGDSEAAWRVTLETIHEFYAGDFPPFRLGTTLGGLVLIEDATPRVYLDSLINRERLKIFELSKNAAQLAFSRSGLIRAALRAGLMAEANEQLALEMKERANQPGEKSQVGLQTESEVAMAELDVHRGDLPAAQKLLDDAGKQLPGQDNSFILRIYAMAKGELELALGHPETAETTLRSAILEDEREARGVGRENIISARQDRDLYATLAGIWLAEGRDGKDILSLWERYRLRILGKPVPACRNERLDCLTPQLQLAMRKLDGARLLGQVVLWDRILRYSANQNDVTWSQSPFTQDEVLVVAGRLERTTSFPGSSKDSVDQAAERAGEELLDGQLNATPENSDLVLEPDPLLGNLPWPAVEVAKGPVGLYFNLQETPSLLLSGDKPLTVKPENVSDRMLIVGASRAAGQATFLPEALREARSVAEFSQKPELFVADQATETHIEPLLPSASIIHFAGHAAQFDGQTRLLLAPSGKVGDQPFLDAATLERNPPRQARLVVFSACSSGKQEAGWDHGMGDIVDTLSSLGVPEVVATRWQIDSASAVPMMDAFYQGLSSGLSVPQALTAARRAVSRDAHYQHPYYWAAYYASGTGSVDLHEVFNGNNK